MIFFCPYIEAVESVNELIGREEGLQMVERD